MKVKKTKKHWTQTKAGKAKLKAIAAARRHVENTPNLVNQVTPAPTQETVEHRAWFNREKQPRFIEIRGSNFSMTVQFD